MVLDLAVGAAAAGVRTGLPAGVLAPELDARQVAGAVVVAGALGVTPGVRLAEEVLGAGALGAVVDGAAVGVLTAGYKRGTGKIRLVRFFFGRQCETKRFETSKSVVMDKGVDQAQLCNSISLVCNNSFVKITVFNPCNRCH